MEERLRLMAVHAHPDDESSKGAATTAKYVAAGVSVRVVSCTGGERGDILNEQLKNDPHILRDLSQVRRDEMKAAQQVLGCEHTWLGFVDSGLPEGDPLPPLPEGCFGLEDLDVTTEALVRVIREHRPHVMTTYDEKGGYPHPDHIMCHVVSMAAFVAAGDSTAYPQAGAPWQPLKLYYNGGFSKDRLTAMHQAMLDEGLESPYADWLANWKPRRVPGRSTHIDCGAYFETRDRALLAHATQVDPEGFWFRVPLEIQQRVWGFEEFEPAVSYVAVADDETDLFAGVGSVAEADALAVSGNLSIVYDGRIDELSDDPTEDAVEEAVDEAVDEALDAHRAAHADPHGAEAANTADDTVVLASAEPSARTPQEDRV